MHIRQLTLADLDQLQSISRTTFHETFAADNSEADMAHYLEHNLSASRLAHLPPPRPAPRAARFG